MSQNAFSESGGSQRVLRSASVNLESNGDDDEGEKSSKSKTPRKLQRPKKIIMKKQSAIAFANPKFGGAKRTNFESSFSSINMTILDSMREVNRCPEIPDEEKKKIREFLQFQGEHIGWMNHYESLELDLDDEHLEERFENRERTREKHREILIKASGWLNDRIEFGDRDDEDEAKRIYVSSTKCERLNEMLNDFFNDDQIRKQNEKSVLITPKELRKMIRMLTDDERELLGRPSEVETDEFAVLLAREICDEVRKLFFERWQEMALLEAQNSPTHDEADEKQDELFAHSNSNDHESLERLRQETMKSLIEVKQQKGMENVDQIIENMINLSDDSDDEDDDDEYELKELEPEVVTLDDMNNEVVDSDLPPTNEDANYEQDEEIIWLESDEDDEILAISPPLTPSARPPLANIRIKDFAQNRMDSVEPTEI